MRHCFCLVIHACSFHPSIHYLSSFVPSRCLKWLMKEEYHMSPVTGDQWQRVPDARVQSLWASLSGDCSRQDVWAVLRKQLFLCLQRWQEATAVHLLVHRSSPWKWKHMVRMSGEIQKGGAAHFSHRSLVNTHIPAHISKHMQHVCICMYIFACFASDTKTNSSFQQSHIFIVSVSKQTTRNMQMFPTVYRFKTKLYRIWNENMERDKSLNFIKTLNNL